jgi:hypothetical protein
MHGSGMPDRVKTDGRNDVRQDARQQGGANEWRAPEKNRSGCLNAR